MRPLVQPCMTSVFVKCLVVRNAPSNKVECSSAKTEKDRFNADQLKEAEQAAVIENKLVDLRQDRIPASKLGHKILL